MSVPFFNVNLLRIMQEAETDADSPDSEEMESQFRENWEVLTMLGFYTGDSGTATENPTETILTDDGAAYTVDEHNGRSLVIIDGTAAGNIYTIDDGTATTLTCTGDTLLSDGVLSGDAYKVFYNLKHTSGHEHDGVDSYGPFVKTKVGVYTGDGSTDQGITGLTFTPQAVMVVSASDQANKSVFMRISGQDAGLAIDFAIGDLAPDKLISLDADGFSVDDGGTDAHPNTSTHGYVYIAWG